MEIFVIEKNKMAKVAFDRRSDTIEIVLEGYLDCPHLSKIWEKTIIFLEKEQPKKIMINASQVIYCDGAGATLFAKIRSFAPNNTSIEGLKEEYMSLVDLFSLPEPVSRDVKTSFIETVGRKTYNVWNDAREMITFTGEVIAGLFWAIPNRRKVPWADAFSNAESAGVNALPIICLIGFLLGLIMAFQSAVPMKQFGAEIFVADLVGLSMIKELGPLLTAIVLAGRSGSAFAAELGTMKVNEEINALTTMGLNPVRYLALTRIVASMFMTPILSLFCCLFALVGGAIVILSLGYPIVIYIDRIVQAVPLSSFLAGFFKSVIFAILVAGVGCLRGLQTGTGAKAVGEATTSAVVSGIVLVAIADAVFSVIFFFLGI